MISLRNIMFLFLAGLFLSSCSPKLSPFTQRMYDDFSWSESELKSIQFYLSDDIVLRREKGSDNSEIDDGKIRVKDGRRVEEVIFKEGTPGIVVFTPKENRFAVSFDESDNYLIFGPSKKNGGRYTLRAKDWERRYGKISYNGATYYTDANSAFTSLMVDIKKAQKVEYSSDKVKGRKVN
jgi:hypothetical protein